MLISFRWCQKLWQCWRKGRILLSECSSMPSPTGPPKKAVSYPQRASQCLFSLLNFQIPNRRFFFSSLLWKSLIALLLPWLSACPFPLSSSLDCMQLSKPSALVTPVVSHGWGPSVLLFLPLWFLPWFPILLNFRVRNPNFRPQPSALLALLRLQPAHL